MMNYNKLCGLLSITFSYEEVERTMNSILKGNMFYEDTIVKEEEIKLALRKIKNRLMMVRNTIKTLENTSRTLELDVSDSIETLNELEGILVFMYNEIANS